MINNDPIALEVEILAKNNKIYKYGFEVVKDKIISEWLYEKRINKFYSIFERENNNVTMKTNKISGLANIDERTLFLNIYSKIDRNNEDFSNVYDWFVNSTYLDLGNPNFERFINNRVSLKILSDENYKKELLKFIKTFDSAIDNCNYNVAWSNPNFEIWLLAHFKKVNRYVSKDDVLQELSKEFQKNGLGKYTKNDGDIFDKVTSEGKLHTAIRNCEYIEEDEQRIWAFWAGFVPG